MNFKLYIRYIVAFVCGSLVLSSFSINNSLPYVNPTGTYRLVTKVIKKGEMGYGMNGEICVKLLSKNKIVMTLYFNKGWPGYHSGSIVDTSAYIKNKAIYTTPEYDKTCKMTFEFSQKGIDVDQKQDNLNNGCGFGQGVLAYGYYKKVSSKVPILKEPGTDEMLK